MKFVNPICIFLRLSDKNFEFSSIVQCCAWKKREKKDLKAKRQMRKAKNPDKIASYHFAIFCIFK